jgi:CheY-like chemotaxis protein
MISFGLRGATRGDTVTIKLLAVDDSNTMRKVLGITFAGEGFEATICKSGTEALESARARAPDVALIDAYLAGENGYELCTKLRAIHPTLPVLILASKQRPYDEGAGRTVGAVGTFDKPFDSQKLIDKVQSVSGAAAEPAAMRPSPVQAPPAVAAPVQAQVASAQAPAERIPSVAVPRPSSTFAGSPAPRPQAPVGPASRGPTVGVAIGAVALTQKAVPASSVVAAAPAAAVQAASGTMAAKLNGLGLSPDQVQAVLALSREVVEQVVWEVVPALAETMIKEEIRRLTADAR